MEKRGAKTTPLVTASGQAWKVTFGIGAMFVAAAASILQLFGPPELKSLGIAVAAVTGGVGIASVFGVRCPSCGRSLGYWAARAGSLTTWHEKLVEAAVCPYCGHTAAGSAGGRR